MKRSAPIVSICMVTFGALESVRAAIESVRKHTTMPYQLVVVDNGSTDGTREWLRTQLAEDEYIESPMNTGFSGGNNLAVNSATAPFVCLLNSDTIVPQNWLEPLVAAFAHDPGLGIAVPLLLNRDGTVQEAGCSTDATGRAEPMFYGAASTSDRVSTPRSIAYGSAACWLLRTAMYRELGGLDCGYGLVYYEDVDFAFALRARGLRVQLVPAVHVVHAQGASSNPDAAVRLRDIQQKRFANRHATDLAHHSHIYDLDNEPHRFAAARDVDCATRTLYVLGTAEEVRSVYDQIRATVPFASGHHSLCTTTAQALPFVSQRADIVVYSNGVHQCLDQHLFHFSEVRASRDWLDHNTALLQVTQPQAETSSL